jgi:surface-anchored protein
MARPSGADWDPTGVGEGEDLWVLPQVEQVGVPFLGVGAEEIGPGDFVGDEVTVTLEAVATPSDAGHFSLYQTDAFGEPDFFMSSFDGGISPMDAFSIGAGGHLHFNYAFTEPGVWEVTFRVSGTHSMDGFVEGLGTYHFSVVPEPVSAVLLFIGCAFVVRRNKN